MKVGYMKMYQLVYAGQLIEPVFNVEKHQHPQWELVYVKSGTGVFHINNQEHIDFSPGDIFMLPPNMMHYETAPNGYTNYFVFFNECFLPKNNMFFKFRDTDNRSLLNVIRLLQFEYNSNITNGQNIVDSLFQTLGQYIRSLALMSEQTESVREFKQEIEAQFRNPEFKIGDYQDNIPYNPDHFRRLFKKSTGYTPLQYMLHLRLEHSKFLIASRKKSGLSFQQIAYQSGFKDPYYFSRLFKKKNKLSPRDWEKLSPYN